MSKLLKGSLKVLPIPLF